MLSIVESIIIVLSLWGFSSQLILIRGNKCVGTFSIQVPGVVIIACLIKISFYFIQPFAKPLILQAFLLIMINILLLKSCIDFRTQSYQDKKSLIKNFWNWRTFRQYILFLIAFTIVLGLLTFVSISFDLPIIGQIFGYFSTVIEIYLAIPQILSNFKNKSVEGVSKTMVALWITNDSLKTSYFIYNSQPIQFVMTGSLQSLLDVVLIFQMIVYSKNSHKKAQDAKNE